MPAQSPPVPLRRNARFQLLWIGAATSALGTQFSTLAYPLLILAATGSPALAGLVGAVAMASDIFLGLPAGALVDRWDRRRTMLVCEAVRMLTVAVVAVAIHLDQVSILLLVPAAMIQGCAGALLRPARLVTIRAVVPKEQLTSAFAQEEARVYAAYLGGPPLGGLLFGVGRALPFAADAVSYLVSWVCIWLAKVPRRPANAAPPGNLRADIIEGLRWLWREPFLRGLVLLLPAINVAGAGGTLLVVVLLRSRGVSPPTIGLVLAAEGAAGLLGALLAARIAGIARPGRLMVGIVWSWALMNTLLAVPLGTWWVAVFVGCGTVLGPATAVIVNSELTARTPEALLGRTLSSVYTLAVLFNPLGPLLAGILAETVGPTGGLLVFAGYLAVCAVVATASGVLRNGDRKAALAESTAG